MQSYTIIDLYENGTPIAELVRMVKADTYGKMKDRQALHIVEKTICDYLAKQNKSR